MRLLMLSSPVLFTNSPPSELYTNNLHRIQLSSKKSGIPLKSVLF